MNNSIDTTSNAIQINKDEIFMLPTRVIDAKDDNEEDFSDLSSNEENINETIIENEEKLLDEIEKVCESLGYDLDGRLHPDDTIFEDYIEAANFSPFVITGEAVEIECVALWDYFGGNSYCDLNVTAGDTVYAVAEEYQVRCSAPKSYNRLPFQWTLARWISDRPIDPYLGLIPSHYIIPKKFYTQNPLLFKYPVWFHGNCEADQVVRRMFSDRSALCPGLFAIFSPPWLNPDPREHRCYFLMYLVARDEKHNEQLIDLMERDFQDTDKMAELLNEKLAGAILNDKKNKKKDDQTGYAIEFLSEITATPFIPSVVTITRSQLGHYELMSKRYETLYDLVYYLANHRSNLPYKLVYNMMSADVVQPKFVPPPVTRFEKDLKAQPMTIEQWAAIHFDQITSSFENNEKLVFVSKSVFDSGKKAHEKLLKKISKSMGSEEYKKIMDYINLFNRPDETKNKKRNRNKKKDEGKEKNEKGKEKMEWSKVPQHATSIHINSPFLLSFDRIKREKGIIGSGAFGTVQIGSYQKSEFETLKVAVKFLKFLPTSKDERNQAWSEIEILQMVCHPNVVLFYGFSFTSDTSGIYLLFELMEMSLDKFVDKAEGKISENEILDLLAQICRGMSYLHTRTPPVVHGDLAARNVLLKKHPIMKSKYIAKITDLGLAKLCRDELYTSYNDPNKIPFKWLPPEVLGPRILTLKTDVWAFGIICFEMYRVNDPYGILEASKVYQYLNDGYRFEKMMAMSPCVLELALECFRKQPVDRPPFSELERRFLNYIIEEDEQDELISKQREKEMLEAWKQKTRKEKNAKVMNE